MIRLLPTVIKRYFEGKVYIKYVLNAQFGLIPLLNIKMDTVASNRY